MLAGSRLGHYRIQSELGRGGMGIVYRAHDEKLDRDVALKVLPSDLATDSRRARLEREAKAIAALNHPNIVHVYSVDYIGDVHFVTMELVSGRRLDQLIPSGGLPLGRFFDLAVPLADAVAAAHDAGVTHRDLKPQNVMVSDDDRVKVLDFGLAKSTRVSPDDVTMTATREGAILGTPRYMSPEQARGEPADARSDMFSLGIMLYEMLTGQPPFEGETSGDLLAAILTAEPRPVSQLRPGLPRELVRLIRRCLVKDPSRRQQSVVDLRNELDDLRRDLDSGELRASPGAAPPARRRWPLALTAVGSAAVVVALALFVLPTWLAPSRLEFGTMVPVTSAAGVENFPTWSPDGRRIAYESTQDGNSDIWIAQVNGGEPRNFTGDYGGGDFEPAWSPDDNWIAFVSLREGGGIFRIPAISGQAIRVSPSPGVPGERYRSPQWSQDSRQMAYLYTDNAEGTWIVTVNLEMQMQSKQIVSDSAGFWEELRWSPDGQFFAYRRAARQGWSQLWLMRAADGQTFEVTDGITHDVSPFWSRDSGWLYFVSNRGGSNDLWRKRIGSDGRPLEVEQMTFGVGMQSAAFSPDERRLAYSKGRRISKIWRAPIQAGRQATWADVEQVTFDEAYIQALDLSPDGRALVFDSDREGNLDLYRMVLGGTGLTKLTFHPAADNSPRFSPDGMSLAFGSYRTGDWEIFTMPADGGQASQLTDSSGIDFWPDWAPDRDYIAFYSNRTGTADLFEQPTSGGDAYRIFADEEGAIEYFPRYSPDRQWLAFTSDRGDGLALYLMRASGGTGPIPERRASDLVRVIESVGTFRWSHDSRRIYFRRGDHHFWEVSIDDGSEAQIVVDLTGRPGGTGGFALAVSETALYFTWQANTGDIWVTDVANQ